MRNWVKLPTDTDVTEHGRDRQTPPSAIILLTKKTCSHDGIVVVVVVVVVTSMVSLSPD